MTKPCKAIFQPSSYTKLPQVGCSHLVARPLSALVPSGFGAAAESLPWPGSHKPHRGMLWPIGNRVGLLPGYWRLSKKFNIRLRIKSTHDAVGICNAVGMASFSHNFYNSGAKRGQVLKSWHETCRLSLPSLATYNQGTCTTYMGNCCSCTGCELATSFSRKKCDMIVDGYRIAWAVRILDPQNGWWKQVHHTLHPSIVCTAWALIPHGEETPGFKTRPRRRPLGVGGNDLHLEILQVADLIFFNPVLKSNDKDPHVWKVWQRDQESNNSSLVCLAIYYTHMCSQYNRCCPFIALLCCTLRVDILCVTLPSSPWERGSPEPLGAFSSC